MLKLFAQALQIFPAYLSGLRSVTVCVVVNIGIINALTV